MGPPVGGDVERAGPLGGGVQHGAAAGRRRGPLTVRLQAVVQHHPARAHLLDRIHAELPDATVVTDPGVTGTRNAWRCYRACLEAIDPDATHLLVVQDDAIPCRHFAEVACAAVRARPDVPVVFFIAAAPRNSARQVEQAGERCEHWALLDRNDWVPVVALSLPAPLACDLAAWADGQHLGPRSTSDDAIVGEWVRARSIDVYATVPSLVQHDDMVPSLMGNVHLAGRNPARVAACWIGDHDGRQICW